MCLLLLCEMYKYLWSRKGEEGEEETETNGSSRQHFRLFGRRKIIRKFVVPSATLASLNTHAQVKMHNRQLKWKLTHELVSHSSHFHLEHQQQAHSTGEIVHKLSAQQSLAAPTKAARAGMGSSSRNRKQEQKWEAGAATGTGTGVTVATHKSEPKVQTKIIAMLCRLFAQPNRQLDFSHFHSYFLPPPVAGEFACR